MASHPVFRVENLGPIRRGEVELRPLTLLIGKNNTGKTYMAQAIHACHKALQAAVPDPIPTLEPTDLEALEDLVSAAPTPEPLAAPPGVLPVVEQWLRARFQAASACLPEQMHSVYGIPTLDWLDSWDSDRPARVSAYHHSGNGATYLFGNSDKPPDITVPSFDLTGDSATRIRNRIFTKDDPLVPSDSENGDESQPAARTQPSPAIADLVWNQHLREMGFGSHSFYLPAGRSGLLKAYGDVIQRRLQAEGDQFDQQQHPDASLGGAPLDMLAELQGIFARALQRGPQPRENGQGVKAALALLEQAIDGTVVVELAAELLPNLIYQQNGRRIPLHMSSALVTEIALLVLWIKELIAPGDLIIVDEPEAHLHPEARSQVARALVRLANAGVKVLCVTHSSTLIHQISNCMLAATVSEDYLDYLEDDLGFPPEDRISVSDIGVFRFMRSHDAAEVEIVPEKIDPGWGIREDEFVDMSEAICDQSADLIQAAQW